MSALQLNPRFDAAAFLQTHWQRNPVLLPDLIEFSDPLTAAELAGLACEDEVESRLVIGNKDWQLRHGPFIESDFTALAANSWTLLVQGADLFINEFRALKDLFHFIPRWRLEDVMASFATPGGGVGPHFDFYDVFLVQGSGQRRWKLGKKCDSSAQVTAESGLMLLENFTVTDEFLLNPGDVLYIPPQYAHWGVAESASFCYSVGFRAPSSGEMLEGFSDALIARSDPARRFTNTATALQEDSHEITVQDLNAGFSLLQADLADSESFYKWFGAFMTQPKYPELLPQLEQLPPTTEIQQRLAAQQAVLTLNPASRLAYCRIPQQSMLCFFVDGRVYPLPMSEIEVISKLCKATHLFSDIFCNFSDSEELLNVMLDMIREGSLLLDPVASES